jgi:hypothetical protein
MAGENCMSSFLSQPLNVINLGIETFDATIRACGGQSVQVDWRPAAPLSAEARAGCVAMAERMAAANEKALATLQAAKPVLTGMGIAGELIPGMAQDLFLHAGPPITWARMCGPMRGAMIGAVLYEGLAATAAEAEAQLAAGRYRFAPCHAYGAVGPMAGVVSASMPVFVVENQAFGNLAFCTQNEGLGKVLRYGAFSPDVIDRLKWMEQTLYPALKSAIEAAGGIDLKNLIAQALHMGDEVHNRNRAGTSLLLRALAPWLVRTAKDQETAAAVIEFINGNDHFFLNLSMPACKASLDPVRGTADSSMVVAMARNGTDFGVQLAGTGDAWFTGAALVPDALFFAGYTKEDANPDIGDSTITETAGLGGFAIAAAPAIVQFVGGSARDAINYSLAMYEIAIGENSVFQIPALDFRGTPTGIDALNVVRKGVVPFLDTGVAHKDAGVGQVGAGVVSAPMDPFVKAVEGLISVSV